MKRKVFLAMLLILAMTTSVAASVNNTGNFSFVLDPPLSGSLDSSAMERKSTSGDAKVETTYAPAYRTSFFISDTRYSSSCATEIKSTKEAEILYLEYESGHGKVDNRYCVSGYPSSSSFSSYTAEGLFTP